jgi:hypothetical protein
VLLQSRPGSGAKAVSRRARLAWAAGFAAVVAACVLAVRSPAFFERTADYPPAVRACFDTLFQPWNQKRRIADLGRLREALERYRADHGGYPESALFDGKQSDFGLSRPDWIQGLAPGYLARLPADPRWDGAPYHQYLYCSDGVDYKLLSHLPEDIDIVAGIRPDMIDPNNTCSAYGYWTPGARTWYPNPRHARMTEQRMGDIVELVRMLDAYRARYGGYPKSEGFDGLHSSWGRSGEDWIAGLVPEFGPKLPHDPRNNPDPANQYLYKSDGHNYKLIVHHPEDCRMVKRDLPHLVDPVRGCLAYGVWTAGAKDW